MWTGRIEIDDYLIRIGTQELQKGDSSLSIDEIFEAERRQCHDHMLFGFERRGLDPEVSPAYAVSVNLLKNKEEATEPIGNVENNDHEEQEVQHRQTLKLGARNPELPTPTVEEIVAGKLVDDNEDDASPPAQSLEIKVEELISATQEALDDKEAKQKQQEKVKHARWRVPLTDEMMEGVVE